MSHDTPSQPVRVLAICGSLRPSGSTLKALRIALEGAGLAGAETRLADLSFYDLTLCTGSKAHETKGRDFSRLRREIGEAHGIILGTPEYHGSFSGALKNALDHFEIADFQDKVLGLTAVAGGKQGANGALTGLRAVAKALKAWVIPLDVSIPEAHKAFDAEGRAADPAIQTRLLELGKNVARFAALHSGAFLIPKPELAASESTPSHSTANSG